MTKSKAKPVENVEEQPSEEAEQVTVVTEVIPESPVAEAPKPEVVEAIPEPEKAKPELNPNDIVTVTVLYGSIATWKDGSYKAGDVFQITRAEALKIDPKFITIQ